jgi:clusterin-associated protein 1
VRTRSLSKPLDLEEVQLTIRQRIEKAKTTIDQLRKELSVQSVDAENLRAKIDKKKAEVDRTDKRLKSLETVRPAFMDEFEKLEEELANLVSLYAARKRNVGWLKSMVEDSKKREAERAGGRNEWAEMREKMKNEERETLIGGGAMAGAGGVNVVGSLTAEGDDDDSDVSDVTGEDEDEDDDDDDQDDDSGLGMGTGLDRSGRRRGLHGDDDDELDDADLEGLDDEDSDSDGNGGDARGLGSESESESVVFDEDDGSAESDDF